MIRAAFFTLVLAVPAMAQATKTPTTKAGSAKTAPTKTSAGKTKTAPPAKTTLSGVYTLEEATAGKELYAGLCGSCHNTANQHNAPEFRRKWTGKRLADLFVLMRETMPKNDHGSLAEEDYGVVLAYILQMNKMPPGKEYLSTDTLELRKIKFDTVRAVQKP